MEPLTSKCPKCSSTLIKQRKAEREGYDYYSYSCPKCAFEFVERMELERLLTSYRSKIKEISTGYINKGFDIKR